MSFILHATAAGVVARPMYARSTAPLVSAEIVSEVARRTARSLRWTLWLCAAYMLVLVAWSAPTPSGSDVPVASEPSVKAAFLFKFLGYVEWRAGTLPEPTSPIVIGVMGGDAIADALATVIGGRKVGEHPVEIRRLRPNDSLDGVHLLFVGREHSSRTRQLASLAQRRGILFVTDYEGALEDGSAINLVVVDNRVRFEVSLDATEKSGIKLSSRLLAIALWVRPAS